jgi:hypothetical protein
MVSVPYLFRLSTYHSTEKLRLVKPGMYAMAFVYAYNVSDHASV